MTARERERERKRKHLSKIYARRLRNAFHKMELKAKKVCRIQPMSTITYSDRTYEVAGNGAWVRLA